MSLVSKKVEVAYQQCIRPSCGAQFDVCESLSRCPRCGELLDVQYRWEKVKLPKRLKEFSEGFGRARRTGSGVWRYEALLPFAPENAIISIGEGKTILANSSGVEEYTGMKSGRAYLQYEGLNPSGSFKDNGMTAGFTHANMVGAKCAACASTGNTSASLALYAAATGLMRAIVFVGSGKIAFGKLSQALEAGALTVQIDGDFDDAMARVQEASAREGIYLLNSVNPFRLEGQKTIMYRVLEGLGWEPPDWVIVPGGNLGNSSAFGKAFDELNKLGLLARVPRLAVINSIGAPTFERLVNERKLAWNEGKVNDTTIQGYYAELDARGEKARTVASAIEINRPVNLKKALRALAVTEGVVRTASDTEILDAKAVVGRSGLGCEPASAASVAGLKKLVAEGVISKSDRVACVLTGHALKDPNMTVAYHGWEEEAYQEKYAGYGLGARGLRNLPVSAPNEIESILAKVREHLCGQASS
ncbi:MAG: threonine synthase [Planctomycetota bacterium]